MTILQVCAYGADYPGNFICSLEALEAELKKSNINTIYAFPEKARNKEWCQKICKRTKVYFLPENNARILPRTYNIFRTIYRSNSVDIIHSHFELYDIPATETAPKKARIFWHLHDALKRDYEQAPKSRKLLSKLQYSFFGKKATLLSVSKEHGQFAAELGFDSKHIIYFPNGIDTARIKIAYSENSSNQFLMFGWDVIRKGVDLVVDAANKINQKDCRILIIGQDDCRQYLDSTPHSDSIVYLPPTDDINSLYSKTKAFIHVSRAEGLSYALLEVLYAGIPVICSDIPENQFAKEFRNVFFVHNQASDEIAEMIDYIAENVNNIKQNDIAYNRSIIENEYSLKAWCHRLINLYMG